MKRLKPGKTNEEDRLNFVRYWAEYIRTHPDKDWSEQQKMLIDSQISNANNTFSMIKEKEGLKRALEIFLKDNS